MMSRAYWIGLMPRSLSSVRSHASRPMPAIRMATLVDLLVDLRGGHLQLRFRSACSIKVRDDQRLKDFFTLAGDAFIGQPGPRVTTSLIHDGDRVAWVDRNGGRNQSGLLVRPRGADVWAGACPGCCPCAGACARPAFGLPPKGKRDSLREERC